MAISANEVLIAIKAQDNCSKAIGGITSKLKSIAPVALGAGAALAGVGFVVADLVKAAADEEKGIARLQTAIGNLSVAHKGSAAQVEVLVAQREKLAYADDQIRDSLSLLVAQTGDYDEAVRRQAIAMDLARGTGLDLETASKVLGKVTDENTAVLTRYGIVVRKGADAQEVLATVQAKFGGQAKAYAGTAAGAWQRFTNQIDNLKETFGAALLPAVTKVAGKLADFLSAHQADIQRMIERVSALVSEGFERLSRWFNQHRPQIEQGLASFAAFIGKVKEAWQKIQPIVETVFRIWENEIATKLKVIKDIIDIFMAVLKGDWGKAWEGVKRLVLDVFDGLKRDMELKLQLLNQLFGGFIRNVVDAVKGAPSQMLAALSSWLDAGKRLAGAFLNGLRNVFAASGEIAADIARTVVNAIIRLINTQVIDRINSLLEFTIPIKWGPDIHINPPDIGRIQTLVAGTAYVPRTMLAFLHEGEAVLNRVQAQQYRRGELRPLPIGGARPGVTIINSQPHIEMHNTFQGLPEDMIRDMQRALERTLRRAGYGGSFVVTGAFTPL